MALTARAVPTRFSLDHLGPRAVGAIVACLLLAHFLLAVGSKRHESTTTDELPHLTSGFSAWQNRDYRLHPENGLLPRRWAALPTYIQGATFPKLAGNEYWRTSDAWVIGHEFLYETGEDHFPRLMCGRAMIALFSIALGALIFFWSRHLFGTSGALFSLILFTFYPSFLAHGALVTSDVCMAFFFLASVGAWWWHLHDARWRVGLLSAVVFGLSLVAKFAAPLLVAMLGVLGIVRGLSASPLTAGTRVFSSRGGKFVYILISGVTHGLIAALMIWTFYGFRYSAFNPVLPPADDFIRPWPVVLANLGGLGGLVRAAAGAHLLPEAYLYGFSYTMESTHARAAFLNGQYSTTGWLGFFPWAFALKSTVPFLLALAFTALLAGARWARRGGDVLRNDIYRTAPLLVLVGVYWAVSLASHLNIGERHLLPTYPPLLIGLGALGAALARRGTAAAWLALALLAGWHAGTSLRVAPHFLAYFNELAGGPEEGRWHLVDSSLDWGQDLPGLRDWLAREAKPQEHVFLSYFGAGEPAYYHIHTERLPFLDNFKFPEGMFPWTEGLYCISATMLSQVYSPVRGPWTPEFEAEYEQLRAMAPRLGGGPAAGTGRDVPSERIPALVERLNQLRLARLCSYLRQRAPDANVGYSIEIFRVSAAEVHAALDGSYAEWKALVKP